MVSLPRIVCFVAAYALSVKSADVKLADSEGIYSVAAWKVDWKGCDYEDGVAEGRVEVVRQDEQTALRVRYPKGSHGSDAGGAGWRFPLPQVADDNASAALEYMVLFEEGFDFVRGGKLPGLCGGPKTITGGDAVNGKEGWSARLMWRKDGHGQAYVYHMNQPSKYGDEFDFPKEFRFMTGVAYRVRVQVKMNTLGKRDGELRVSVDEALKGAETVLVDRKDMEWRAVESIGVNSILFNTFHGGSGSDWAPSKDVFARFWNFKWWLP